MPDRVNDAPIRLNCYGLTGKQWDDVCEASLNIHLKLIEIEPGEDAFDEESLILSKGLSALYLTAIARLEAEKQAAHTEGWNACVSTSAQAALKAQCSEGHIVCRDCIVTAIEQLSKPTAAKPEPSPSSANRAEGETMKELLTAEEVLVEVDEYCTTKGNPALAVPMRQSYMSDKEMPPAVLVSLNLEPVTMYRRKQLDRAEQSVHDVNFGDIAVLEFDCGCELRIFPRDREGGLLFGSGNCTHDTHQRPLLEILQWEDGLLLRKFHISRAEGRQG